MFYTEISSGTAPEDIHCRINHLSTLFVANVSSRKLVCYHTRNYILKISLKIRHFGRSPDDTQSRENVLKAAFVRKTYKNMFYHINAISLDKRFYTIPNSGRTQDVTLWGETFPL